MWNEIGQGGLRTVVTNGICQNVLVAGEGRAGTVLLIHGLGWDHSLWRFQLDPLVARGWRIIAPDLRGMGRTEKPEAPWSIDDHVADLVAVTDVLAPERLVVAGFSLGGMIAAALAIARPDRVAGLFIAAASVFSSAAGQAGTEKMLARAEQLGPESFAAEQARAIWHPDWAARHPNDVTRFIAWRAAMDQAALFRAFRSSYGIDLRPALPALRMPVRIVAADDDPFASVETLRETATLIPGADLIIVRQSGHMIPIERPDEFTAALTGFLDRLGAPAHSPTARTVGSA